MSEQPPTPFQPESEGEPFLASVTPIGVFAELGHLLHSTDAGSLTQVLQRVADLAVSVVPEMLGVSVTLIEDSRPKTVVFAGVSAALLDERQYERGFGPYVDAALTGSTIAVDTADPVGTYPDFARIANGQGIGHVLAVGLPIPQRTVGALNFYSTAQQPFSLDTVALAEAFAGYAAIAVANATLYHSAVDEARHMHEALKNRAVIEQAKGVLMATQHCTADHAFLLLTQASQRQNRKLHAIAEQVVHRVQIE